MVTAIARSSARNRSCRNKCKAWSVRQTYRPDRSLGCVPKPLKLEIGWCEDGEGVLICCPCDENDDGVVLGNLMCALNHECVAPVDRWIRITPVLSLRSD